MTEELIHEIERLNRLEKELQSKWGRGENIPEELLTQIKEAIERVRKLQKGVITLNNYPVNNHFKPK